MIRWVITFLILALVAGFLGFGGIASASLEIAKLLFFVFLVLFVITLVVYLVTGRKPPVP
jgi:uncharacterized membrane protein YtjA (UPF0391 family)